MLNVKKQITIGILMITAMLVLLSGCSGYQNSWPYPEDVTSVYVEMFDTASFRRGYEFELTDAICKRIESHTPYKIVSDRQLADTVLSGRLSIGISVLAGDRYSGSSLEREALTTVTVTWKNLKTGEMLIDAKQVEGAASYSQQLGQTEQYAVARAVNDAAQRVVELMETPW